MSETPKDNIPESSTENPSAIGEDETTEAGIKSFVLEGRPCRQLKLAIDSLSDQLLNDSGLGRIDVNEDGLEITVTDDENCIGHVLLLAKADMINFRFYKPLEGMLVPVDDIFLNFDAEDDDTFTISHDHGSTELCFVFGNGNPPKEFKVELMENTKEVPKFPSPISFCEANVPSDELRRMLPHLSKDDIPQLVMVYITDKSIIIKAGGKQDEGTMWNHKYDPNKVGLMGMGPGQKHYAELYWPYAEIFETTSQLAPAFILCFLKEPANNIMFKFPLLELGRLEFIKAVNKILPNVEALADYLMLQSGMTGL